VTSFLNLMQFVLLGLVAAPVSTERWTRFLPITMPSHLIGRSTVDGTRLWNLPRDDLALAVGVTAVCLVTGMIAFARAELTARRQGLIGIH
jgi:ABC-2 type transport system permease protein